LPPMPTSAQTHQQTTRDLKSPGGRSCPSHHPLRNQRCFIHNPPVGEHHTKRENREKPKLTTPDSPNGFKDNTHTHAPRDTRACPHHPAAPRHVAHRMRTHFNPQQWLLCHMGMY
jgi:hypothetical protein